MKAEELMIGDWVMYDEFIDKSMNHSIKITHLDKNSILTKYYYPIPLTAEILEKNGFEVDKKDENMLKWHWSVIDDCISYDKSTGIVRIFYPSGLVFVKILEFVHELQHALRLCNIDKEIVL